MSTEPIIDVRKVIEESTQVKTIRELEREGRRAVKVVRAGRISELISEAVDNVIRDRSIRVEERGNLIQAAGDEFKRLLEDAEQQRKKSEQDREALLQKEKEILEIRHKLELAEDLHAEDLRLLEEQRQVVDELKEKVELLKKELEELVRRHQGESEEREALREELTEQRSENRRLRKELTSRGAAVPAPGPAEGGSIRDLVSEVAAMRDSFERRLTDTAGAKHGTDDDKKREAELISRLEGAIQTSMDQLASQFALQLQGAPGLGKQPVEAAKIVLDNLFTEIPSVESNFGKLSVKSSEGSGIGANLERLKKMHQRGIGSGGDAATGGSDSEVSKGERHG